MNKPIRNLSVFCLVLFLALVANATFLQYGQAGSLSSLADHPDNRRVRDLQFSRERGAILVDGKAIAESKKSKDSYKFLRTYPAGPAVRPDHRLLHPRLRPRRDRVQRGLDPLRQRQPALRRPGDRPVRQRGPPRWQRQPRPSTPRPRRRRTTGCASSGRRQRQGRRGRAGALHRAGSWRWSPAPATTPTPWPPTTSRPRRRPRPGCSSRARTARCRTARSRTRCHPARRSRWSPGPPPWTRPTTPRARWCPGATPSTCPRPARTCRTRTASPAGATKITLTQALDVSCNVAFGWLGPTAGPEQAGAAGR